MKIQNIVPLVIACGFASQSYAANQVNTDETRISGANAIGMTKPVSLVATGATAEATLEGLTGFAAIHDFGFTGNQSTTDKYIFSFTDSSVADMQLSYTGSASASSVLTANSEFYTSSGEAMRAQPSGAQVLTMTIELGSYNTGTSTFNNFTTGQGVSALGFTLSGSRYDNVSAAGVTITYLDADDNTLSTQNIAQQSVGTAFYGYTGYQSTGAPIASVSFTFESDGQAILGLDDIGTTAIPEPSSFALLSGCLALGAIMIRRRRA